jgi:hypothetical protein
MSILTHFVILFRSKAFLLTSQVKFPLPNPLSHPLLLEVGKGSSKIGQQEIGRGSSSQMSQSSISLAQMDLSVVGGGEEKH